MDPKQIILNLLDDGHLLASQIDETMPAQQAEAVARKANSFFHAASALLAGFPEHHNALIDDKRFVAARRFLRRWQVS